MEETPKEFINNVLIKEIKNIVDRHPYLAFSLICSGIELLGKCIDIETSEWHQKNTISSDKKTPFFDLAIEKLFPEYYKEIGPGIRDTMRNGLSHSLLPKLGIGLSELKHVQEKKEFYCAFEKNGNNITFIIELFYNDFKIACENVIKMNFDKNNKMNKGFLDIPIIK